MLDLRDPCQSDPFPPGLEDHSLHLAVLNSVVRSISPGLEQPHPGHAWTRLHWGLAIQGHQPLLLCAFLVSWLPDGVIAHCYGHILFSIQNVSPRLWTPVPQTVLGRNFPSEENHTLPPQLVQLSDTSCLIKFCTVSHCLQKINEEFTLSMSLSKPEKGRKSFWMDTINNHQNPTFSCILRVEKLS